MQVVNRLAKKHNLMSEEVENLSDVNKINEIMSGFVFKIVK